MPLVFNTPDSCLEVGQSQVENCLKAFLIEGFDFALKTLLTEGNDEIIHALFNNMNSF